MKAMILAAGRGSRLGRFTEQTPKPLIKVQGRSLIEHRLLALAAAGIKAVVINVSYLAEKIQQQLGDGSQFGLKIIYSLEPERLETGGGIKQALSLLGEQPFLLTNADLLTDFPYEELTQQQPKIAHLVLVKNPKHVPAGDFSLMSGKVVECQEQTWTYSGIAVINPRLFINVVDTNFPLTQALAPAIAEQQVTGEVYHGQWVDIGREEELLLYV
jgi:MurNAc alpha-1-phosphate uridylyltransferase